MDKQPTDTSAATTSKRAVGMELMVGMMAFGTVMRRPIFEMIPAVIVLSLVLAGMLWGTAATRLFEPIAQKLRRR
jgi:hypothetical protein